MMNFESIQSIGIIPATPPITYHPYCDQIARGVPPQLEYLVKNSGCRRNFDDLMPGTKSIVCCAVRLPIFEPNVPLKFARFCAIGDYHDVLRKRISELDSWLRTKYSVQCSRICVDTAPILERELAARAGLGTIGFNRMVIHPDFGSFIAIGELLVDIDLMPYRNEIEKNVIKPNDEFDAVTPGKLHCCKSGNRKCVQACPTGALLEEGYDVHKCLAYWTTQHKGVIPEPYASAMKDVIWGCDRCQNACPRNAKLCGNSTTSSENNPLNTLTFREILTLSVRKLRMRLAGSSIADAHPYMLIRNACIVIHNLHIENEYLDELRNIAENHPCEWVKEQCAMNK